MRKLAATVPLAAPDRAAVAGLPHVLRTLEPSSYVVREGEPPEQCGVLLSGFAYRHKLTGDGARQIVALHIAGEPLDLQNVLLDVADHNVQTLTRAEVAVIPRASIEDLMVDRPAVARALLLHVLIEASILREWLLNMGRRDARTRLAHLLCEIATRLHAAGLAEEYSYELPMTQEQLGDTLGLTPVHVNRSLRALEGEGLIVRSKRKISFPDWDGLRESGDFNPRYLHLDVRHASAAG